MVDTPPLAPVGVALASTPDTPLSSTRAAARTSTAPPSAPHPSALDVSSAAARVAGYAQAARQASLSRAVAVGAYIRELREARGLSQADVCDVWERQPTFLSRVERGRYVRPSSATLGGIADALGLTFPERAKLFELAGREMV